MVRRLSSPAKCLKLVTLTRPWPIFVNGPISTRFVVGTLLPQRELNGVYRYFLHKNPEICVKNFMRSTQPIAISGVSEAAIETLEDQVDLAV